MGRARIDAGGSLVAPLMHSWHTRRSALDARALRRSLPIGELEPGTGAVQAEAVRPACLEGNPFGSLRISAGPGCGQARTRDVLAQSKPHPVRGDHDNGPTRTAVLDLTVLRAALQ